MIKYMTAIEHDGLSTRSLTALISIISEDQNFDIISEIKVASEEFVETEIGQKVLDQNCGCFNFADFISEVPPKICHKHGFKLVDSSVSDYQIDWDMQLVPRKTS